MAELDRAQINSRIRLARDRAGLTQPELGEILQVHWRTVQTWEDPKGGRVPWDRLDEIGRATRVSRDWLLHGDDQAVQPGAIDALRADVAQLTARVDTLLETVLGALGQAEPPTGSTRP